ncbi:MAG: hypothetical protein RJB59_909, partial [Actinomycetota bacterium]
ISINFKGGHSVTNNLFGFRDDFKNCFSHGEHGLALRGRSAFINLKNFSFLL